MKKNFVMYENWAEMIISLPDDMAAKLIKTVCQYEMTGDIVETDATVVAIFRSMKEQLDKDNDKYSEKVNRANALNEKKSTRSRRDIDTISERNRHEVDTISERSRHDIVGNNKNININISSNEDIKDIVGKPDDIKVIADDIKVIVDYLNERTGSHFKANTSETKKSIKARLKEGYTVDDFKRVIDSKVKDWADDDRMKDYLRPQTLFRPANFEAYLNAANRPRQPDKKNKFNNYQQNEYDFDELERQLIQN